MNEFSRIITQPDFDSTSTRVKFLILDLPKTDVSKLVKFMSEFECSLDVYLASYAKDLNWVNLISEKVDRVYGYAVNSYQLVTTKYLDFNDLTKHIHENTPKSIN